MSRIVPPRLERALSPLDNISATDMLTIEVANVTLAFYERIFRNMFYNI
nr:MAG TPA: hypothetical protein [Microviridae sp.]